jgi:nitrite reductase (NADH) large subunit
MSKRKRLLVIGGGMSGTKFVMELIKQTQAYDVTVLSDETEQAYNRIMLSPLLAGETNITDIMLYDYSSYKNDRLTVHQGVTAKQIDHQSKTVLSTHGTVYEYDTLIVATGSTPIILPIENFDAKGVLGFRTTKDVEKILAYTQALKTDKNEQECIVIGAGLLGLEAASALAKQGVKVYKKN